MKNLKILLIAVVLFVAFGFTLIGNSQDVQPASSEIEVASVEIDSRFSDDAAAFE